MWRDLGYVVGALVAGLIADIAGIPTAIVAVALVTLASALVTLLRLRETLPKRPSSPSQSDTEPSLRLAGGLSRDDLASASSFESTRLNSNELITRGMQR